MRPRVEGPLHHLLEGEALISSGIGMRPRVEVPPLSVAVIGMHPRIEVHCIISSAEQQASQVAAGKPGK